mgnify:FL=1
MKVNLICDTDGIVKGSYIYSKKEREKFMDKVADITEDEEIQVVNIDYGYRKDIKCYYINFEYYWLLEVDDEEDVKQISAAFVQKEVDKVVNWETRKYESSSGA